MSFYREERHPWIQAHQEHFKFLEKSDQLIEIVLSRLEAENKKIDSTLAWVLDLDSTLFSTARRSKEIYKSFLDFQISTQKEVPESWVKALETITPSKQSFSIRESIEWALAHHVESEQAKDQSFKIWEDFQHFWEHNFFASTFMNYDEPYSGAPSFVKKISDLGFSIVYLTGRDTARSMEGTLASLASHQFPLGERCELILKPGFRWSMSDVEFKQEAARNIAKKYEVVAAVDNEPENLHAFANYFPQSEIVLFHSIMSNKDPARSIMDDLGERELLLLRNF